MSSVTLNDTAPALLPPNGTTSNSNDPPSLSRLVIGTLVVCLSVALFTQAIRLHAQLRLFRRLTWADAFVSVAWACHVVFCALLLSALPHGLGRHQWDVREANYVRVEYLLYISFIIYDPAILFAKLSILYQFIEIFAGTYRNRFWWAIMFLIAINVIFYVAITFGLIFSCEPLSRAWNPAVPGHCVNQKALLTSSGPFNVISDFLIFILPIWGLWQLRLPLQKRIAVSAGLTIGLFGCICSAVRIAYTVRLDDSGDSTWIIAQNQLWANAEITVGIMIANLLILPRYIKSFKSGTSARAPSNSNPSTDRTRVADFKYFLQRRKNRPGMQAGGKGNGDMSFTWDDDEPMPQGEDFHRLTNHSRHLNTNTLHSRLSEEMDLGLSDRVRVAPWASFDEHKDRNDHSEVFGGGLGSGAGAASGAARTRDTGSSRLWPGQSSASRAPTETGVEASIPGGSGGSGASSRLSSSHTLPV